MTKEMREPTFAIMSALAEGPRHGYAIITEARELSGGSVALQPGTLYAALDRLRSEGLVDITSEEVVKGRLRRSFALTDRGLEALSAEATRRREIAERALARLRARANGALA